ncbi:MAG: DUF1523 family protein [Acidiferrobacterales bacterium]
MRFLTILKYTLLVVLIVVVGLFLHYHLPRTDVVQITGTDVKRMDTGTGRVITPEETGGDKGQVIVTTRDVRFISAVTRKDKVKVFRNEDTGWGWPPYFKFDSADVTAEAQAFMISEDKPWVRIRYYGWRIKILSMFPNAISLKVVDKDYRHIPWFNIIFLALLAVAIAFTVRGVRRLLERLQQTEQFQALSRFFRKTTDRPRED